MSSGDQQAITFHEDQTIVVIQRSGDSAALLDIAAFYQVPVIIIKDEDLGKETAMWMTLGSFVNGVSFATAIGSIVHSLESVGSAAEANKLLAALSALMRLGYLLLWRPDREGLADYRITKGPGVLSMIRGERVPITIMVQDSMSTTRNLLYSCLSTVAYLTAFWDVLPYGNIIRIVVDKIEKLGQNEESAR